MIKRSGSYFYTRAYRKLVVALTTVYATSGVILAELGAYISNRALVGIIILAFVTALISLMWLVYGAILWIFAREARQTVELTREGIRETHNGREHAFIPWTGVTEIEVAATIIAGASLRVKGMFSEITISNVDLEITGPCKIREMHKAMGRTGRMRELLGELKTSAPHAEVRLNRLARRRVRKYAWMQP